VKGREIKLMRTLFFAYTPFQCMAALAIKEQFYKDSETDIMISDSVHRRNTLKDNILENDLFDHVYYGDIRTFFPKSQNKIKHEVMRIWSAAVPTYIAKHIEFESANYDVFVTTEVNYYTESIFSLLKKVNPNIKVELMDEGYSSYTYYFRENYRPTTRKNKIKRLLFRALGLLTSRKYISDQAKKIYYFAPELLCWKDIPYQIEKIDTSLIMDYRSLVNQMFGYGQLNVDGIAEEYKEKFIFFEESFFWSQGNQNDVEIINRIADIVGKENMIIKLHPRNQINRFEDMGYKTNKTEGIPWELVVLNMNPKKEKVFITFSSGAVLNFKFLVTDNKCKSILLYDCKGVDYYSVSEELKQWFLLYKINYGSQMFIPRNMDELRNHLVADDGGE